jgi:hypothetical protein
MSAPFASQAYRYGERTLCVNCIHDRIVLSEYKTAFHEKRFKEVEIRVLSFHPAIEREKKPEQIVHYLITLCEVHPTALGELENVHEAVGTISRCLKSIAGSAKI